MRFAFVTTMNSGPWGGSEELWSLAAMRLRQQGHEVAASVFWWPKISPKVTAMIEQGVKVDFRNKPKSLPERVVRKIQRRIGAEPSQYSWLVEQKPDLAIVAQGGTADGLDWMNFCRTARIPFAVIVQCNYEAWWPSDKNNGGMPESFRTAKKVFCVSNHNLRLLEVQIGESLPNMEVVRNPCNVTDEPPPPWPKPNGTWNLACVARLEPTAKGQDVLFQVLAQPKWRERPVKLNLFGAGDWEQGLKKLAAHLKLDAVTFRGHVKNVRAIWEEHQLLVLPSRFEGLPLALVEAMWCGRPAVVTDVGGNAEVCDDGKTGFVAAAPVVSVVDEALEKAWNRRDEWESMGRLARVRVEELYPKDPVGIFCKKLTDIQCRP